MLVGNYSIIIGKERKGIGLCHTLSDWLCFSNGSRPRWNDFHNKLALWVDDVITHSNFDFNIF